MSPSKRPHTFDEGSNGANRFGFPPGYDSNLGYLGARAPNARNANQRSGNQAIQNYAGSMPHQQLQYQYQYQNGAGQNIMVQNTMGQQSLMGQGVIPGHFPPNQGMVLQNGAMGLGQGLQTPARPSANGAINTQWYRNRLPHEYRLEHSRPVQNPILVGVTPARVETSQPEQRLRFQSALEMESQLGLYGRLLYLQQLLPIQGLDQRQGEQLLALQKIPYVEFLNDTITQASQSCPWIKQYLTSNGSQPAHNQQQIALPLVPSSGNFVRNVGAPPAVSNATTGFNATPRLPEGIQPHPVPPNATLLANSFQPVASNQAQGNLPPNRRGGDLSLAMQTEPHHSTRPPRIPVPCQPTGQHEVDHVAANLNSTMEEFRAAEGQYQRQNSQVGVPPANEMGSQEVGKEQNLSISQMEAQSLVATKYERISNYVSQQSDLARDGEMQADGTRAAEEVVSLAGEDDGILWGEEENQDPINSIQEDHH